MTSQLLLKMPKMSHSPTLKQVKLCSNRSEKIWRRIIKKEKCSRSIKSLWKTEGIRSNVKGKWPQFRTNWRWTHQNIYYFENTLWLRKIQRMSANSQRIIKARSPRRIVAQSYLGKNLLRNPPQRGCPENSWQAEKKDWWTWSWRTWVSHQKQTQCNFKCIQTAKLLKKLYIQKEEFLLLSLFVVFRQGGDE